MQVMGLVRWSSRVHRQTTIFLILTSPAVVTIQLQRNRRPQDTIAFTTGSKRVIRVHPCPSVEAMDAACSFRQHELRLVSIAGGPRWTFSTIRALGRKIRKGFRVVATSSPELLVLSPAPLLTSSARMNTSRCTTPSTAQRGTSVMYRVFRRNGQVAHFN